MPHPVEHLTLDQIPQGGGWYFPDNGDMLAGSGDMPAAPDDPRGGEATKDVEP